MVFFFFFQAEDGIRDLYVTGVQTCALPICDKKAWLAIVIPVTKINAHAGNRDPVFREGHEGLHSYFLEALTSMILEEKISFLVVRDEDIHPTITIVVGDGYTHALPDMFCYACCGRDVRERAITIIVIQKIRLSLVHGR